MNYNKFNLLHLRFLILIFVLGFNTNMFGQTEPTIPVKKNLYELLAITSETQLKENDEIIVKLEIKNNDSELIKVIEPFGWHNGNRVEVVDKDGNKMPLSENAQKQAEQPSMGSRFAIEILPQGIFVYEINISKFYNLPIGKYKIFVWRYIFPKAKKTIEIEANPIEVSIVEEYTNRLEENQKLIQILQNESQENKESEQFTQAIERFGKRNADETLSFPAVNALSNIGKASLPSLINIIRSEDENSIKSKNALMTIYLIFGKDLWKSSDYLKEIENQTESIIEKKNLRKAIEKTNSIIKQHPTVFGKKDG